MKTFGTSRYSYLAFIDAMAPHQAVPFGLQ